jgi:hypothetical protein
LCIRCNWPGRRPAKDAKKFPSLHRGPQCFTSIVPIRTCDLEGVDVRFGSEADMCSALVDVRFGPKADIVSSIRLSRPPGRSTCWAS